MDTVVGAVVKQHLIDPESCIRCGTCESTCPSGAITHGADNYVVDFAKCQLCMACIQPCPTGAIDNWRMVSRPGSTASMRNWGGTRCPKNCRRPNSRTKASPPVRTRRSLPSRPRHRSHHCRNDRRADPVRRHAAAVVGRASLHQPVRREQPGHCDRDRQHARDRGRARVRHPPHRARPGQDTVPGARRPIDRCHSAGCRRLRPATSCAPILGLQRTRWRASGLQQPVADRQARAPGPPGQPGSRRGQQLPVRPQSR